MAKLSKPPGLRLTTGVIYNKTNSTCGTTLRGTAQNFLILSSVLYKSSVIILLVLSQPTLSQADAPAPAKHKEE